MKEDIKVPQAEPQDEVVYGREGGAGRTGPIGRKEIDEAFKTCRDYKSAKSLLEQRIIENEQWLSLIHI